MAYFVDPLVDRLERRGVRRTVATLIVFLGFTIVAAGAALVVVPLVVAELRAFAERVPTYVARVREQLVPMLRDRLGIALPTTLGEIAAQALPAAQRLGAASLGALTTSLGGALAGVAAGLGLLVQALVIPVLTFYFLRDFDPMVRAAGELVPPRHRAAVGAIAADVDRVAAAWLRGQLTVMLILGALYAVGLSLVGVRLGVVIGLLSGLLAFVPYLGVATGCGLALVMAALEWRGAGQVLGVLAVFGGVQALDGLLITPYVVGERVGLGPAGVMIALLLGGQLFGLVGVLLAVPLAAVTLILLRRAVAVYRASALFGAPPAPPPP